MAAAETSENPHKIEFSFAELDLQRDCQFNHLACVGQYLQVSPLERILGNLGRVCQAASMDEDRRVSAMRHASFHRPGVIAVKGRFEGVRVVCMSYAKFAKTQ
ncbi:hypothetical protein [Tunturiibacter gelidoferens]|uniref:Uncharacterized protein n=1 Tax=Tunturiibacter gelidiferens TaxID=3069689 RepID=A0ACC5P3V8_9BACT|nr:hypothetical protein [Edaphobacter lichenicola]MBB5341522.1 hypothetical protein [Edaphobacter lichenicola]